MTAYRWSRRIITTLHMALAVLSYFDTCQRGPRNMPPVASLDARFLLLLLRLIYCAYTSSPFAF